MLTLKTLPERLREATRSLHQRAESSGAMPALVSGRLPHAGYQLLLAQLQALYEALEAGLRQHAQDSKLQSVVTLGLWRAAALQADMGNGAPKLALVPATRVYVERLNTLRVQTPFALLAHAYTRWLGDLHGGQLLRTVVQRHYPGQGTAFYEFGAIGPARQLQGQLRDALAQSPLTASECDTVVEEACWSFQQHVQMFEEIELALQH